MVNVKQIMPVTGKWLAKIGTTGEKDGSIVKATRKIKNIKDYPLIAWAVVDEIDIDGYTSSRMAGLINYAHPGDPGRIRCAEDYSGFVEYVENTIK